MFAGIAADKTAELDLDTYIAKQCFLTGTSGSTLDDLKMVLRKVVSRQLDTNLSVAAVSGLYPACKGMKLTPLPELGGKLPLTEDRWTKQAEDALLAAYQRN